MAMAAAGGRNCRRLCAAVLVLVFIAAVDSVPEGAGAGDSGFITWDDLSMPSAVAGTSAGGVGVGVGKAAGEDRGVRTTTIVVSQDGTGHSRTVQGAVDMVPAGNRRRVKILVRPGVYREKVTVPITKPFVSLIGMDTGRTVITWHAKASDVDPSGHQIGTFYSASVAVEADYFCASHITFENSAPAAAPGAVGQQAVALRLSGDKTMLYRCRILGTQDTLFDNIGRHYLYNCDIQGSIDFIFGNARSLYQGCTLHAVATSYGAIAASQRGSPGEDSGFSFVWCKLTGSGMLYLGRAWGRYARVVYSYCDLSGIVVPQGWSDWGDRSRTRTVLFGEYSCKGPGASTRQRVPWSRELSYEEARPFLGRSFINGERWLRL
ncbi:pectinesterase QRT1-like [Phragmites australis]|uniref:pectinesterase QRT1-like n=1 Tax=Phragmites australis TaxID=29695 RepID=UPI002D777DB8|nr:pectinesterase QRT1-like [Phragmites australis]